ncbi:MAG: hypothetical protein ACTSRA_22215 [Promethearchaeota archaeon]
MFAEVLTLIIVPYYLLLYDNNTLQVNDKNNIYIWTFFTDGGYKDLLRDLLLLLNFYSNFMVLDLLQNIPTLLSLLFRCGGINLIFIVPLTSLFFQALKIYNRSRKNRGVPLIQIFFIYSGILFSYCGLFLVGNAIILDFWTLKKDPNALYFFPQLIVLMILMSLSYTFLKVKGCHALPSGGMKFNLKVNVSHLFEIPACIRAPDKKKLSIANSNTYATAGFIMWSLSSIIAYYLSIYIIIQSIILIIGFLSLKRDMSKSLSVAVIGLALYILMPSTYHSILIIKNFGSIVACIFYFYHYTIVIFYFSNVLLYIFN